MPYPVRLPLSAILKLDSAGSEVNSPELRVNLEGPNSTASTRSATRNQSSSEEEESTTEEEQPTRRTRGQKAEAKQQTTTTAHVVTTGETLYSIAQKNGISVEELKKSNNITSYKLRPGQTLHITKVSKTSSTAKASKHSKGHKSHKAHSSKKSRRGRR